MIESAKSALLVLLCVLTLCVIGFVEHLNRSLAILDAQGLPSEVKQTLTDLNRTIAIVGATSTNVEKASRSWKAASEAEVKASTSVLTHSADALAALQTLASNTDARLNGSLLPNVEQTVVSQSQSLLKTQKDAQLALESLDRATEAVRDRLSDPALPQITSNLAKTSENASQAVSHLSETAASGERVAKYYEKQLTTPAGFWKTVLSFVLDTAYKVRQGFL